jgi:hypothetical protein
MVTDCANDDLAFVSAAANCRVAKKTPQAKQAEIRASERFMARVFV